MQDRLRFVRLTAVLLLLTLAAAPTFGLSMERQSLEQLANKNTTILTGTIVDAYSYWNADGSWIVTDIVVAPQEMIKGTVDKQALVITMLGGTVGDRTVVIPGAPRLEMGKSYVMFVREENLPGAPNSKVLATYTQSVFDIVPDKNGFRAVSQAGEVHLYPDADGKSEAVGGTAGMNLEVFKSAIRAAMAPSADN